MAPTAPRPGRTLVVFLLAVVAMYIGLAFNGVWQPNLGLDLQGGTRITLSTSTETGESVTPEKLEEAAGIIDNRVNAFGVAESEVVTQGARNIVVELPGVTRPEIVDAVSRTAQLRFRVVAAADLGVPPEQAPGEQAPTEEQPTEEPTDEASPGTDEADQGDGDGGGDGAGGEGQGRALSEGLVRADQTPDGEGQGDGAGQGNGQGQGGAVPTNESSVKEILDWTRSPDQQWQRRFAQHTCTEDQEVKDNPARPLVTCDESGVKYLLSPAIIEGTQLDDAGFGIPQNDVQYAVTLDFDSEAATTFAEVTRAIVGTGEQFAIVLDGTVLSAPVVNQPITDGNAQITGDFTAEDAESLANSLRYGALPLSFQIEERSQEGPTLAAGQLEAGLWAGAIGLLLVVVFAMLYYRALGLVVVGSLAVAAAVIYASILFLSETAGFTLTLPGIAGLIVGVGITADSFIVLFERIRDEMRDGKSVRVAIESGWDRAKITCVVADAVGLLAAVVLFIFAIGVVKGFAFTLGITTVIDLVVFFWFTKPLTSWLARFRFFGAGHKLSGFSAEQAGIDRIGAPRPAGGFAR